LGLLPAVSRKIIDLLALRLTALSLTVMTGMLHPGASVTAPALARV
jgi:hypothetical protein